MTIRDTYYDDLVRGPFLLYEPPCAVRANCLGMTMTFTYEKGHQFGRALASAIGDGKTPDSGAFSQNGPWEVEVLDEEWEWEGAGSDKPPVCVTYDNRFEFIISWDEAYMLAEDYDTTFADEDVIDHTGDETRALSLPKWIEDWIRR